MKYLFEDWESLEKRLIPAGHILLCLDFDGTVTPIRPRPKDVQLNPDIRGLLRQLSRSRLVSVGIISGRALKDLQRKVGVSGLILAGNHGLEITYKKKNFVYPKAKRFIPVIARLSRELKSELAPFRQAIIEQKRLSLSVHYRLVEQKNMPRLRKAFFRIIRPYLARRKIRLTHGKKVWETRPPITWDKGRAILWLLPRLRPRPQLAIYLGDDLTDEDAFRAVNKTGGVSILVGRRKLSSARYYLKNTKEIQRFLKAIAAEKN